MIGKMRCALLSSFRSIVVKDLYGDVDLDFYWNPKLESMCICVTLSNAFFDMLANSTVLSYTWCIVGLCTPVRNGHKFL